ncbi:MAG: hypothetical protein WBV73_06345 [Phormidium sp.]
MSCEQVIHSIPGRCRWRTPLQAAQNQGIAQLKYGKRINSVEYTEG